MPTLLATFVKQGRKLLHLSQPDLAAKAGVELRFVRELEQDKPTLQLDKVNTVLRLSGHELVNTTAFESPDGPVLLGMLHVQGQTTRDLVIEAEAFTCSVLLNPYGQQHWSTVRVNFAQVWQVLRSDSPQVDLEEVEDAGGLLYDAPEVLSAYTRQGRIA